VLSTPLPAKALGWLSSKAVPGQVCKANRFADRPASLVCGRPSAAIAEGRIVETPVIERHYYSVPYSTRLVGEELEARYTATAVEIFYHGVRVASHRRGLVAHAATTLHDHRPKSHQAHLE